jgi:RES domain-containing protein
MRRGDWATSGFGVKSSVALAVPSVTSGERNILLNPEHPQFCQIDFHDPVPFRLDIRLLRT